MGSTILLKLLSHLSEMLFYISHYQNNEKCILLDLSNTTIKKMENILHQRDVQIPGGFIKMYFRHPCKNKESQDATISAP